MKAPENRKVRIPIRGTRVFQENLNANTRIVVNQGGTRSSKTYSIAQFLLIVALTHKNITIDICRKTLPSLKATAWSDFQEILQNANLYDERNHNKTERTYRLGSNLIRYYSVDEPQKVRGWKRDFLWLNEANEFTLEDWRQLSFRTTQRLILDYNPSDEYHWIYDEVIPRDDCTFIKSTYLDNPFLNPELIGEIERLQQEDENYWRVYGLGERGVSQEIIYTNWDTERFPDTLYADAHLYGLDFGFNNPSALIEIKIKERDVYVRERIYRTHLTNQQLIEVTHQLGLSPRAEIYADSGEPDRIEEFGLAGFNIFPAVKSVADGIDSVKTYRLHIDPDSVNLLKEIKNYKWKIDRLGHTLDEPVKFNDHGLDAIRYAIYSHEKSGGDVPLNFGKTRLRRG